MTEDRKIKNRERAKAWALANKERNRQRASEWYKANKEKALEAQRLKRKANPAIARKKAQKAREKRLKTKGDEVRAYHREYALKNKEKIAAYMLKWRLSNPEKYKEQQQAQRLKQQNSPKHKDKRDAINAKYKLKRELDTDWRKKKNESMRNARKLDPNWAAKRRAYLQKIVKNNPDLQIKNTLRVRVISAVKKQQTKKANQTQELIGCTTDHLRQHLESQFKPGMTWENRGYNGWHIDHIKPCASFDLSDPTQQRACFHWSNLQPLWGTENQIKGARFNGIDYKGKALRPILEPRLMEIREEILTARK